MSREPRAPHPATLIQSKVPHAAKLIRAKPQHPSVLVQPRLLHGDTLPCVATLSHVLPPRAPRWLRGAAERGSANSLGPSVRAPVLQRMEQPGVVYAEEQQEIIRKGYVWELALAAFDHMRRLVITNDKDSAKGPMREEDYEAARIYKNPKIDEVGACARIGSDFYFATNRDVPQTAKDSHSELFPASTCHYLEELVPKSNAPIKHAEMKIYTATGGQAYIGVSKLCCLYCAAQLLASGFRGFRGCSMAAFNNYAWLPAVYEDSKFRAALWGGEVESHLLRFDDEMWGLFLRCISNGATLLQKYRERWGQEHLYALRHYSKVNQYSYFSG
jgi:hypothetical protein